jgi:hypothetical protein
VERLKMSQIPLVQVEVEFGVTKQVARFARD